VEIDKTMTIDAIIDVVIWTASAQIVTDCKIETNQIIFCLIFYM